MAPLAPTMGTREAGLSIVWISAAPAPAAR